MRRRTTARPVGGQITDYSEVAAGLLRREYGIKQPFLPLALACSRPGSFANALIGALGVRAGCACTLTFDKAALRLPGFELP